MKQFKRLTKYINDFDRYAIVRGALLMFLLVSILAYGFFSMSPSFFVIQFIIAVFVLWVNGRVIKMKKNDASSRHQAQMTNRVLATALADTSIRVFIYYKATGKTVFLKGGMETPDNMDKDSLEAISESEGFSADDTRKLKNSIALVGVGKSVKFTLCSHRDGKETFLRYTLVGATDENGDPTIVIGTARDITEDETHRRRQIDLEKFRNSVVTYKTTGFEIALERNKWKIMWMNEPAVEKSGLDTRNKKSSYDEDMAKYIIPCIHPEDREQFSKFLDRLTLLEDFRRGKTEKSLDYRILTDKNNPEVFEYRITEVHLLRDKDTDEAKADVYVRNIENADLEKFTVKHIDEITNHILSSVLGFMSTSCARAAFAQLDEGVVLPVSFNGRDFLPKLEKFGLDEFMEDFAQYYVQDDYKQEFLKQSTLEYFRKELAEKDCISMDFVTLCECDGKNVYTPVTRYAFKIKNSTNNEMVIIEKIQNSQD